MDPPVQPSVPRERDTTTSAPAGECVQNHPEITNPNNGQILPSTDAARPKPSTETIHSEESDSQNIGTVNVAELTAQIMEMISKEDDENSMSETGLLKKNVELQEFLVKLIELLKEKTNLCANLESQNSALTNQAKSLRDVIGITKDLLQIRNMEVDHLHIDMAAMEKSIKEERERHNMAVQRLGEAMTLNDKLKTEYLNQLELFGKLRDKYNEKVAILMKENKNLKELMQAAPPVVVPTAPVTVPTAPVTVSTAPVTVPTNPVTVPDPQEIIETEVIASEVVATEEQH